MARFKSLDLYFKFAWVEIFINDGSTRIFISFAEINENLISFSFSYFSYDIMRGALK